MMDKTAVITPRLLNIQQASKYLGCPVWTLRDLEWRGELRGVRNLGRRLLFDIKDLDRYVDAAKAGAR
jgi:excisionase family DNA binding protein